MLLSQMLPPSFLLCLIAGCSGEDEDRQTPYPDGTAADGGITDGHMATDGQRDGAPGDEGMVIVDDSCDCEDRGPCLILPAVCISDTCDYRPLDRDGDGHPPEPCTEVGGDDCNDADPTIYPGAPEICDGEDNNCNRLIDEECSLKGG